MRIELLKEFVVLRDTLNFTKAADRLFISQSVLSRHIKSIEEELGVALFERNHHFVLPTTQGELFYQDAKSIVKRYDAALANLTAGYDSKVARLRVSYLAGACAPFMKRAHRQFTAINPRVCIELRAVEYPNSFREILRESADLLITLADDSFSEDDLGIRVLYDDTYCLCVHPDHKFANRQSVQLAELKHSNFKVLNFEKDADLSERLSMKFAEAGIFKLTPVVVESAESIPVAALPYNDEDCILMAHQLVNLFDDTEDVVFVPVEGGPVFHVVALWRNHGNEELARQFVDICLGVISNHGL